LLWLYDPSQTSGDNLNNLRRETGTHFRKEDDLKDKINELETNEQAY
jgi:hypothetical protein